MTVPLEDARSLLRRDIQVGEMLTGRLEAAYLIYEW